MKGGTNGKENKSKEKSPAGAMEQAGCEPAQTALSRNRHIQNRKEASSQDRRRKKESVQNGPQKIQGLSATHRQGIATLRQRTGFDFVCLIQYTAQR
jgi:hypothetical protein